jgi:hypothetical protein
MGNGTLKRYVIFTYIAYKSVSGLETTRSSRTPIFPRSGDYGFSKVSYQSTFQSCTNGSLHTMGILHACTSRWTYHRFKAVSQAPLQLDAILSGSVTLEHSSKICRQAYPPGKHFTVPQWPDVEEVNQRGDFALEYSRLAYIDGDRDPWRYCVSHLFLLSSDTDDQTPQSDIAPRRGSTVDKPMHLIFGQSTHTCAR